MVRARAGITVALMGVLLSGCATGPVDSGASLIHDAPTPAQGMITGAVPAPAGYQLTADEQKYECRKLTGLMQIRILQMRGYQSQKRASVAARSLQSLTTPIFGGTKEGIDPDAQYARDRAMLEAYNKQLASKRCATFDLEAELAEKSIEATPAPAGTSSY